MKLLYNTRMDTFCDFAQLFFRKIVQKHKALLRFSIVDVVSYTFENYGNYWYKAGFPKLSCATDPFLRIKFTADPTFKLR